MGVQAGRHYGKLTVQATVDNVKILLCPTVFSTPQPAELLQQGYRMVSVNEVIVKPPVPDVMII